MRSLALAIALALFAQGCTSSVKGVPCVGLMDTKKPGVEYELSIWNILVAVVFSETIIVPIIVAAKQYECPVEP